MSGSHCFRLGSYSPQTVCPAGTRTDANKASFPVLDGMSLSLLSLEAKGFREPHWHPNANELGYCLEGKAIMTIFSPGGSHDTFLIEPGVMAFVPMGSLHHIQNIGEEPLKMLLCFNHESPEDLNLSSAIGVMPPQALASTFNLTPSFFEGLHATVNPIFISEYPQEVAVPLSWQTDRYKMNLEAIRPQVQSAGGWVKLSNNFLLPVLETLALFRLKLVQKGVREPHWHPNAHELNYVIEGQARITLLSPSGNVDTFDMAAGDMSFLPKGYLHDIENIGEGDMQMAVFFNHHTPSDIGLSGCLGAYSNELLANLFHVPLSYFEQLPKYQEDLFVVAGAG